MTIAGNLRLLDVDRLADECADQTARFFSRVTHDASYCYELFRRAIVGRNSYAWEKIYRQYQPLVASWVRRHSGLQAAGEEVDYFVNCAFDKMWSAIDAPKFNQFHDVADLLRYLQMCVHSVIVDHTRSHQLREVNLESSVALPAQDLLSAEGQVTDQLERHRLWQIVAGLTRDEKESIVLQSSFLYGLKPSEIYASNVDRFESMDELYRVKRNLLNRLRRNPSLQQFLDS
jgi:RNA polymerase sigma factor (sigma-70 family)